MFIIIIIFYFLRATLRNPWMVFELDTIATDTHPTLPSMYCSVSLAQASHSPRGTSHASYTSGTSCTTSPRRKWHKLHLHHTIWAHCVQAAGTVVSEFETSGWSNPASISTAVGVDSSWLQTYGASQLLLLRHAAWWPGRVGDGNLGYQLDEVLVEEADDRCLCDRQRNMFAYMDSGKYAAYVGPSKEGTSKAPMSAVGSQHAAL